MSCNCSFYSCFLFTLVPRYRSFSFTGIQSWYHLCHGHHDRGHMDRSDLLYRPFRDSHGAFRFSKGIHYLVEHGIDPWNRWREGVLSTCVWVIVTITGLLCVRVGFIIWFVSIEPDKVITASPPPHTHAYRAKPIKSKLLIWLSLYHHRFAVSVARYGDISMTMIEWLSKTSRQGKFYMWQETWATVTTI
jgi:hypothetical protein